MTEPVTLPYLRYKVTPFWLQRLFGAKITIREFVLWGENEWRELPEMNWVEEKMQKKLNEAYLKMYNP